MIILLQNHITLCFSAVLSLIFVKQSGKNVRIDNVTSTLKVTSPNVKTFSACAPYYTKVEQIIHPLDIVSLSTVLWVKSMMSVEH